MQGLELGMKKPDSDQGWKLVVCMNVALQSAEALGEMVGRGWHESGVSRTGAPDPVLALSNPSGLTCRYTGSLKKAAVGLPEEPDGGSSLVCVPVSK